MVEVIRHSVFNNGDTVQYYDFDHGENSGNAAVASLMFVNQKNRKDTKRVLFNIAEANKVDSLPHMKTFVKIRWASNRTDGNNQKLADGAASQAAVYIWDKVLDKADPSKKKLDVKGTYHKPKSAKPSRLGFLSHSGNGHYTYIPNLNIPKNATKYSFFSDGGNGWSYFDNPRRIVVKLHATNYVTSSSSSAPPNLTISVTEEESNQKNIGGIIRGKLEQAGRNAKVNNPQISDSDIERLIGIMRRLFNTKKTVAGKNRTKSVRHSLFTVIPEGELYHHGILGMKWGVRRYQNRNGSLTPEGKEHYGIQTKRSKGANENEHGEKIDKLQKKYSDKLTDATMQRRSAIHYQNKANGEQASKMARAGMASALDKADKLEKKANKIAQKAEKKYGSKFEINDKDYKEVYDEVMKYYSRKTEKEIRKDQALFLGQNLILGGALGGVLWSTLDLADGKNIHSKYKIKD